MQFTTQGPFAGSGSPGCQLGLKPPMLIRVFGFAHGPFVHVNSGPETSRPMMKRRLRPAHSASIMVLLVPSVTAAIPRLQGVTTCVSALYWVVPRTPSHCGSPFTQCWLYRAGVANGWGRVSSVVAG